MRDDDYDIAIKIVVVGNGEVGKSSMMVRYCNGIFTNEYKKTIGVDFLERVLMIGSKEVRLMLWDTAGQEEFDALTKAYYRGAQACVVAFSTTDQESLQSVEKWKKKVEYECGAIPMALVQNKMDLIDRAAVKRESVDKLALRLNMRLFRTSAKNNVNIDAVFYFLVNCYLDSLTETYSDDNGFPSNQSCLKSSAGTPLITPNPLFSFNGPGASKYRKKGKKAMKQTITGPTGGPVAQHSGEVVGAGVGVAPGMGVASVAPLMHHFRYKSRFHFIPMRQPTSTILLHQRCHPHQHQPHHSRHHHHSRHAHHKKHSDKLFKNALFNNCWIL